jgi:ribosomal protein S18 acetylase RimI-like enzyme
VRSVESTPHIALRPITHDDPRTEDCLDLAYRNMNPYLERRGESFDKVRWRLHAPRARFFLIEDTEKTPSVTYGFLGVRNEQDAPRALHVGDVQISTEYRNRGIGWATLQQVERMAHDEGLTELTLNVFRDNPALRLYQRFGFRCIDTQFYKYKLRKTLCL